MRERQTYKGKGYERLMQTLRQYAKNPPVKVTKTDKEKTRENIQR